MGKHGVLLAVSSLPGKYGVGDFSDEAYKFINVLKNSYIFYKINLTIFSYFEKK